MAYTDFTLSDLQKQFNIGNKIVQLFDKENIELLTPSEALAEQLAETERLPIKSEKARSEMIVTPILLELRKKNDRFFTIYSGDSLVADKEKGLVGECDFILAKETGSFSINIPILTIVEAKRQDIELGIDQCSAQLYGAHLLNQELGTPISKVYGCVTTADSWKFLLLEENLIKIDQTTYYKSEVDKILGVFQQIINYYKEELKTV